MTPYSRPLKKRESLVKRQVALDKANQQRRNHYAEKDTETTERGTETGPCSSGKDAGVKEAADQRLPQIPRCSAPSL